MGLPRFRVSGMTMLAGAVLALLPALAWLQYSWLDQIAAADRDRRERTLRTAATQLAQEVDAELSRAYFGLQIDGGMLASGSWEAYAQRYEQWSAAATYPGLVSSVYFVRLPEGGLTGDTPIALFRWNAAARQMQPAGWPADLAGLEARVRAQAGTFEAMLLAGRRGERPATMPGPLGDETTIVSPVMQIIGEPRPADGDTLRVAPPDLRLAGFTVLRLDDDLLTGTLLPAAVRRHFGVDEASAEYRVAVVDREDPTRVVYESEPGIAAEVVAAPDTSLDFMSARPNPFVFVRRDSRRGEPADRDEREPGRGLADADAPPRVELPPPPAGAPSTNVVMGMVEGRRGERNARFFTAGGDHWTLAVQHRAGSLEAAVSAARARNLGLSSGILFLLAAAIFLILKSARRADQLARQQIEFVAAVSHELRTPVAVIGAAAGNLADGVVEDPARVRTYGATIQSEARRLGETVERVLQLAGILAGRAAASPALIEPGDLVREALSACRHEIEQGHVDVQVSIADGLPAVTGDSAALRSAVQNLVSNAVKYGGDARWMHVSAVATPGRGAGAREVRITVEDHGLGIDPVDRRRIFDAFYRGREAVARQIQGSGLGLNLVRRIAEAHGGSVTMTSEPGRGSAFTLHLPATPDDGVRDAAPAAAPGGAGLSPAR
ncbi:MAG: sensor histidine kinase [Vicinamibacterales bacterium]